MYHRRFAMLISIVFVAVLSCLFITRTNAITCTITVSNTNDSGAGSLRQAIISANSISNSYICFSIGSGHQQIIPTSPLPVITRSQTIDGTTQPGFSSNVPIIEISGNGAGSNAIGLRVTGNGAGSTIKGLIINRFSSNGVFLDSGNNVLTGNYIGLTADGNSGAGNNGDGIGIFSGIGSVHADGNTIGGTTAATRNVISGNGANNPNGANGIAITAQNGGTASNNVISGNYIGTNSAGDAVISNNADGVLVNDSGNGTASGNTIGGTTGTTPGGSCTGACNLISGNSANGIGLWHSGVSGSVIKGNYVGLNASGTSSLANGNIGFESQYAPNNTIGDTSSNGRNVISGNLGAGVFLDGDAATGNVVEGNYIGTNANGTVGIGNVKMGIGIGYTTGVTPAHNENIGGTTGTTPGGSCTGACNLISGNGQNGILVYGPGNNQFLGNYIGTNVSGTGNISNVVDGIGFSDSPNNTVGDGTANGRNIIAANGDNGVIIVGNGSTGNRVQSDYIGEGSNAVSLGNASDGVLIVNSSSNAIIGNNIGYNVRLGIELNQANNNQNFPQIQRAITKTISGSTQTKIAGFFNSNPNGNYRLEFFANNNCNAGPPLNYGQGQSYIGSTDVTTDQFGNTSFVFTPSTSVSGTQYVTATATRKIGNTPAETSQFSQCILVNVAKPALTYNATWLLKYYLSSGPADRSFGYGFPTYFLMCAWDSNQMGVKLPVIFSNGTWYMRASYSTGTADLSFSFGPSNGKPVCGDWNGDGIDTIGVVDTNNNWNLRNTNNSGPPDISFQYGSPGTKPVVGDWNGDGIDTIGVVDTNNNWNLRNTNNSGPPDLSFNYGFTPGYPVVGDWNGSGTDTIGSVSSGGTWALRNNNSSGSPDITFQYGFPGAVPIIW